MASILTVLNEQSKFLTSDFMERFDVAFNRIRSLVFGSLATTRASAEEGGGDLWSNLQGVTFGNSLYETLS